MNGGPPRVARLRRLLFEAWGPTDDPVIAARAPGRVNLIGEHTDYNEGLVLPAAIDLDVAIAFRPRTDRRVELHSLAFGETRAFDFDDIRRARVPGGVPRTWIDYVAGTAWALAGAGTELRPGPDRPGEKRDARAPAPGEPGPSSGGGIRRREVRGHGSDRRRSWQDRPRPADRLPYSRGRLRPTPRGHLPGRVRFGGSSPSWRVPVQRAAYGVRGGCPPPSGAAALGEFAPGRRP